MLKTKALELISKKVSSCNLCPDLSTRTQAVFGEGNPSSKLVLIGEGPGQVEDAQGRPFVGSAGLLLDKIIAAMGWIREELYICNIVCCRPPNNRVPTQEEAINCEKFLKLQLKIINPEVIVCLGNTAAKNLLKTEESIGQLRGKWHEYKDSPVNAKVMCTYHPSYILRIEDENRKKDAKAKVWTDLKEVVYILEKTK